MSDEEATHAYKASVPGAVEGKLLDRAETPGMVEGDERVGTGAAPLKITPLDAGGIAWVNALREEMKGEPRNLLGRLGHLTRQVGILNEMSRSFLGSLLPARVRRRRLRKLLSEEFHAANAKASGLRKRQEIAANYRYEMRLLDAEDAVDDTNALLRQARHLRVPVPSPPGGAAEPDSFWDRGPHGRSYLTPAGFKEVRKEVRAEKKWRREQRNSWVVWIAAVTGLVGALTGLWAVIAR